MNPLEKLREDVLYWRQQMETARETLRIAEAVLPGLETQLKALEPATPEDPALNFDRAVSPIPVDLSEEEDTPSVPAEQPRFSGQCAEQVLQALEWKPNQSSDDLQGSLRQYGRAYGRGAIGYAIRDLRAQGKIVEAGKRGNLVFYRLA